MFANRSTRRFTGVATTTVATALLVAGLAISPAAADPVSGTPGTYPTTVNGESITDPGLVYAGLGADADGEVLDNIATQYDSQFTGSTVPTTTTPYLESFDATNPATGATGDNLTTKPGCTAFPRPTGTTDGVTALTNDALSTGATSNKTQPCVDFARSSSAKATNGSQSSLNFWALGQDAVDWVAVGGAYAPTTPLSTLQLSEIFSCEITNWDQVGGQNGAIHVYVNPSTAATYKFFLTAIGSSLTAVSTGCGASGVTTVQQVNGSLFAGDPQAIAPYAVSKWAGQADGQTPFVDNRGGTVLGLIGDTTPPTETQTISTGPAAGSYLTLNPAFATARPEGRILYDVTRSTDSAALQTVASNLFGPSGYICSDQTNLLVPYGIPTLGANCGQES